MYAHLKALRCLGATLILTSLALTTPAQASSQPDWTPPAERAARTPFAPKPFGGDNIFKGEAEVWLADAIEKLEGGIFSPIEDRAVIDYVSRVGQHLVAHSVNPTKKYKFVVTTDWLPDAMTAGGGRIYISRGMLDQVESEDELAGVLAHEIAHDAFNHAGKDVTRQMFWLTGRRQARTPAEVEAALSELWVALEKIPLAILSERLLGFSRFEELEADRAAFYDIYKAGYNPNAMTTLFERRAREEKKEAGQSQYHWHQLLILLVGSHPPNAQRTLALAWEANFNRMPAKDLRYRNAAFDAMKRRVAELNKQG